VIRNEKRKRFDMKFLNLVHLFDPILHYSEDENSYYQLSRKHTIRSCKRLGIDNNKCMILKFLLYKDFLLGQYPNECLNIIPKPHLWEYCKLFKYGGLGLLAGCKEINIDDIERELTNVRAILDWGWSAGPGASKYLHKDFFTICCFMDGGNLYNYSINLSRTLAHENIIIQMMKNIKSKFDKRFDKCFP
jgi:hypothetical protein